MTALVLTAVWFFAQLREHGLAAPMGGKLIVAILLLVTLSVIAAAVVRLTARQGRPADERDGKVALISQSFRGFLYLALAFALLGVALAQGHHDLANTLFLAILGIEFVSGAVMLATYRWTSA